MLRVRKWQKNMEYSLSKVVLRIMSTFNRSSTTWAKTSKKNWWKVKPVEITKEIILRLGTRKIQNLTLAKTVNVE